MLLLSGIFEVSGAKTELVDEGVLSEFPDETCSPPDAFDTEEEDDASTGTLFPKTYFTDTKTAAATKTTHNPVKRRKLFLILRRLPGRLFLFRFTY